MAKQPVKKKDVSKLGTSIDRLAFMENYKVNNDLNGVKDKELEWVVLPEAFHDAIKIPGIPKGYFSAVRGLPNTGKSTIKLCLIAECQRMGILPVIYETESNFPWDHARDCGVEFEEVYGEVINPETGEVTTEVVDHKGFFMYFDSDILFRKYGKMDYSQGKELSKPNRSVAVVEDIAYSMNTLLDQQDNDELPFELFFIWDSVGSLSSYRSQTAKVSNNMWDAGALSQSFSTLVNNRIPISRKEGKKYTNSFFVVNKIWVDNMQMGGPQVKNKGGETFAYGARLVIHMGGITSPSIEVLKAVAKGETYYYGIQTKIKCQKNQVNDITYEGKICSVPHGLWNPDKLDEYKKEHSSFLLKRLETITNKQFSDDTVLEFSSVDENDKEIKSKK